MLFLSHLRAMTCFLLFLTALMMSIRRCSSSASTPFPNVTFEYIWATSINSAAVSYQMADYDSIRNQVLFYPYGAVTSNSGILLQYTPPSSGDGFKTLSNWKSYNLSSIVNSSAVDFGGGYLDNYASPKYSYLVAARKVVGTTSVRNGLEVRLNLSKNLSDPTAYETFDISTLSPPNMGSFMGVFANGYAYYAPTLDPQNGFWHGTFVRYNSQKAFNDSTAWQYYNLNNLTQPANIQYGGMQSMVYLYPYVYLIPYKNGYSTNNGGPGTASVMIRFDTSISGSSAFTTATSYQTFNLTNLQPNYPTLNLSEFRGFTGGVVIASRYIVFIPSSDDAGNPRSLQTTSVVLIFDAKYTGNGNMSNLQAWQAFDLTTVNSACEGYQFGWLDTMGFLWLVPTWNSVTEASPPLIAWNTYLPFTHAASWRNYTTGQDTTIWSCGAAYNPNTQTAYLSPYGNGGVYSARLTQLTMTWPS